MDNRNRAEIVGRKSTAVNLHWQTVASSAIEATTSVVSGQNCRIGTENCLPSWR